MKKLFFILICFVLLLSLTACSPLPLPLSDDGRGIIFENHDKVKIANAVLDIDFNSVDFANITATYNMKNITSESLSIDALFLYPLQYGTAKEIKIMRNGVELDYNVEYFGNSMLEINYNGDWETILNQYNYSSTPFGDGGGFVEYTLYDIDEGFEFNPNDYFFAENFDYNQNDTKLELVYNASEGKIITRQALDLDEHEHTEVKIDNIYDYLEDYYKSKGHYDLLATTISKFVLYDIEKKEDGFFYYNCIDDVSTQWGLKWEDVSQTFGDGSGFFEYTFEDIDEELSFSPDDYYFSINLHRERMQGYDKLMPRYENLGIIITRQELDLYDYVSKVEIDNIYDYLEDYYKSRSYNDFYATELRNSILYNVQTSKSLFSDLNYHHNNYQYHYDGPYNYSFIAGILYNVDFAPNEEVQLIMQYDHKLGSNNQNSLQIFKYFFTPDKYWMDNAEIEINLHLNKVYPKLEFSSLDFEKINKLTYRYVSNQMPNNELVIKAGYPWFKSVMSNPVWFFLIIIIAFILIIIKIVIIIVVVTIKKNKKFVNINDQIESKKFQFLPLLIIAGFLTLTLLRVFLYSQIQVIDITLSMLARRFMYSGYVVVLLLPIAVIAGIGILKSHNGNFHKGLISVLAILSAICFAIFGMIFQSSGSSITQIVSVNLPSFYYRLGKNLHMIIAIFLTAFAFAVIKPRIASSPNWFYVLTILASISILILSRIDIVCLPAIIKTTEFQSEHATKSNIEILQIIGERMYGENYSLLLSFINSIFRAALPFALYAYAKPQNDEE